MGHYFSEFYSQFDNLKFIEEYKKNSERKIYAVLDKNPIKLKDLRVGDNVKMYSKIKNKKQFFDKLFLLMENSDLSFLEIYKKFRIPMTIEKIIGDCFQINHKKSLFPIILYYKFFEKYKN